MAQASTPDASYDAHGLGLTLVSRISIMHGGYVSFASEPKGGIHSDNAHTRCNAAGRTVASQITRKSGKCKIGARAPKEAFRTFDYQINRRKETPWVMCLRSTTS